MSVAACLALLRCVAAESEKADNNTLMGTFANGQTELFAVSGADIVAVRPQSPTREAARRITVSHSPSAFALTPDRRHLVVACAFPCTQVQVLDALTGAIEATIPAGPGATALVFSPDGRTLYVCNRFQNSVSIIDLAQENQVDEIQVQREPVAADITKDCKFLLVANHLPKGRADSGYIAAVVSVIDVDRGETATELRLPNGSTALQNIRVSPDGHYAAVTHLVARYQRPTRHLSVDWITGNALTLIDVSRMEVLGSVLLDDRARGAANPWALAWTTDGATLVVTHAGTHEISIIDFPDLVEQIMRLPAPIDQSRLGASLDISQQELARINYLPFFPARRQRIKLPQGDLGPRAVTIVGRTAYVANYFSDTLSVVDFSLSPPRLDSIPLGPKREMSSVRKGELFFNDATICLQGWQSCASCHPGDGRADGFNWDLLNDGIGNPKNTKSLLLAFQTPPAMSLGVRETARDAIRSGIRHILFTSQPDSVADAIGEYIQSLKPVPSPHLIQGRLSASAERGRAVFARAGCATCHPPPLFTDLRPHDVGTRAAFDKPADQFDTPALVELWRTAPYLHDGSAATVGEVITTRNRRDQHGVTSTLSPRELADLCAYLLSL